MSTVLKVARTPAAREGLKAQFQAHSIERAYEAIVVGEARAATHDTLHGRHPRAVDVITACPARYLTLRSHGDFVARARLVVTEDWCGITELVVDEGARGRGTKATGKPPIFGMAQRSGEAVIRLLDNVRQKTARPLILQTVAAGTLTHTDEYSIYGRLPEWGCGHKTVNHSAGEYARDEDGDGFHEVHANTMEGLWSLLRSWLRPHRGIPQDKLPPHLGFFEFAYNLKRRGKRLLSSLLGVLLKKTPKPI